MAGIFNESNNQIVSVDWDSRQLTQQLDRFASQLPFAIALSLTRTGQKVKASLRDEMMRVFSNPTRWTLNSVYLQPATKTRQEAKVYWRQFAGKGTPAFKYLNPNIFGGERRTKRFEKAMIARGYLKPSQFLIPGRSIPLDAHGNVPQSQINKILSQLKAFSEVGYSANETARSRKRKGANQPRFFFGSPGKKGLGIWERRSFGMGRSIRPFFIVGKTPHYKPIFDPVAFAQGVVEKTYPTEFQAALEKAVATARK